MRPIDKISWNDLKNHIRSKGTIHSYSKLIGIKRDYIYEFLSSAQLKYLKKLREESLKKEPKELKSNFLQFIEENKAIMDEKKIYPLGRFEKISEKHRFITPHGIIEVSPTKLKKYNFEYSSRNFKDRYKYYNTEFKLRRPKLYKTIIEMLSFKNERAVGRTKYGIFEMQIRSLMDAKYGADEIPAYCYLDEVDYLQKYLDINYNKGLKVVECNGEDVIVEDKRGKMKMYKPHLLTGVTPTIRTALDPNEYCKKQFREVHGNFYGYEKMAYISDSESVIINCPIHGYFEQIVNHHKNGKGCSKCRSGIMKLFKAVDNKEDYTKINSGYYILAISNERESYYKAGISKNIKERVRSIKNQMSDDYEIEVVMYEKVSLYEAIMAEDYLLNVYEKHEPIYCFNGYTECFESKTRPSYKKGFYKEYIETVEKNLSNGI